MAAYIELDRVSLLYPGDVLALDATDMKIAQGDFVAIVGPSGCGKSTILKLVAGLIPATGGNVSVAGREVSGPSQGVGMALQNPTMLPWLTIRDNVMLPLKIVQQFGRGTERPKRVARPRKKRRHLSVAALYSESEPPPMPLQAPDWTISMLTPSGAAT